MAYNIKLYNPISLAFAMKLVAILLLLFLTSALDNGLGKTPQMGWNSWNHYNCNINQTIIRKTADLMVSTGLAAKGYRYINIDDCWQGQRNPITKEITQDKSKFPSGMAALAEYVHSKGLLFGLYSDAGNMTCAKRPGSLGYEQIDAKTYAKWGVDYLKYDYCYSDSAPQIENYKRMRDALNATGRPIFFSLCSWGTSNVWEWGMSMGNSWRTSWDIDWQFKKFLYNLDRQVGLAKYAGPGGWNDPDMLQVGNTYWTLDEYQSHFALWAALKAPLLIGCGIIGITSQSLAILGNEEVIAVNQDPLGLQADLMVNEETSSYHRQIWGGPLSDNRYVFVCFNRHPDWTTFRMDFAVLLPNKKVIEIREIIEKIDVVVPKDTIFWSKTVKSYASAMYVIEYRTL